jgi:hypothetical protein
LKTVGAERWIVRKHFDGRNWEQAAAELTRPT